MHDVLKGFKKQALAVSQDPEHRFDLAVGLGELKLAYDLALEADVIFRKSSSSNFCTFI